MKKVEAVLFDGDGVLLDTFWGFWMVYGPELTEKLGLPFPPREEWAVALSLPWKDFIESLLPGITIEEVEAVWDELGLDSRKIPQVPGAIETLAWLKQREIFLGLISSRGRQSLERRFEEAGIDLGFFNYVQGLEDCEFHKPDPRVFNEVLLILSRMYIGRGGVFYVGDTCADSEASKNACLGGFRGVLTGPTTKAEFIEAGVAEDGIIESVAVLPAFWQNSIKE